MWFESRSVEFVTESAPEWAAFVFAALSYLGSVWFVAPVIAIAFWFGNRHRFGPWLAIVIGGYAVMVGTKTFFDISRPSVEPAILPESLPTVIALLYIPMVEVHTTTFPSGHALAAVVVWSMIALEVDWRTLPERLAIAAAMVVLVGLGRIGVAVHYPGDIVAGAALGILYVGGMLAVWRTVEARTGRHDTTSALLGVAIALSLLALALGGGADAAALAGGAVGALFSWRVVPPPALPDWELAAAAGITVAGLAVLGAIVAVAVLLDLLVVWLVLGVVGGALVVGLPRLSAADGLGDLRSARRTTQ